MQIQRTENEFHDGTKRYEARLIEGDWPVLSVTHEGVPLFKFPLASGQAAF